MEEGGVDGAEGSGQTQTTEEDGEGGSGKPTPNFWEPKTTNSE